MPWFGEITFEHMSQLETFVMRSLVPDYDFISSLRFCTNLKTLNISPYRSEITLASVLPKLENLQYIKYAFELPPVARSIHSRDVVGALQTLTTIKHIELKGINLCSPIYPIVRSNPLYDHTLQVTRHMTQLAKITLEYVYMPDKAWSEFVSSLLDVQQTVEIRLSYTNISDDAVHIHKDSRFNVSHYKRLRPSYMIHVMLLFFLTDVRIDMSFSKTNYSSSVVRDAK